MEKTAVNIGASKESVIEAKKAIMEIIKTNNNNDVKIEALKCLSALCDVKASFSNCNFSV